MSPYHALGVDFDATDKEIREAYLCLVRKHPPEREPERFHVIQQAYGEIREEFGRLRRAVLGPPSDGQPHSFEQALLDHLRHGARKPFPTPEAFRSALRREFLA
jgi:curved DNA-binding protein CbpA